VIIDAVFMFVWDGRGLTSQKKKNVTWWATLGSAVHGEVHTGRGRILKLLGGNAKRNANDHLLAHTRNSHFPRGSPLQANSERDFLRQPPMILVSHP